MNVTEFLKGRNVERQAVTRYINRHDDFFKNHIQKIGKELELDEEAVEKLEEIYPLPAPVQIITGVPQEDYIKLQEELIKAKEMTNELQKRLLDAQEQLTIAEASKLLLEEKKLVIEEKDKRIKELQDKADQIDVTTKSIIQKFMTREECKDSEIKRLNQELEEEKKKLEEETNKTWLQKLFRK